MDNVCLSTFDVGFEGSEYRKRASLNCNSDQLVKWVPKKQNPEVVSSSEVQDDDQIEPFCGLDKISVDSNERPDHTGPLMETPISAARTRKEGIKCVRPGKVRYTMWECVARFLMSKFCPSDLEDMDYDAEVRREVSVAMSTTYASNASENIIKRTIAEYELAETTEVVEDRPAEVVPKFAASVVVALRAQLGRGAMDRNVPGNVQVVRGRAIRLMRDYGVRHNDVSLHLEFIERAFFDDDTHYRVSGWRQRICKNSRFCKWAFGTTESSLQF